MSNDNLFAPPKDEIEKSVKKLGWRYGVLMYVWIIITYPVNLFLTAIVLGLFNEMFGDITILYDRPGFFVYILISSMILFNCKTIIYIISTFASLIAISAYVYYDCKRHNNNNYIYIALFANIAGLMTSYLYVVETVVIRHFRQRLTSR